MGRGGRDQNQALRLTASLRRAGKPERLGQRRYILKEVKQLGSVYREPGLLHAVGKSIAGDTYTGRSLLIIEEELAAPDKRGRLAWIQGHNLKKNATFRYNGLESLRKARDLCDRLNKTPLGPLVSKEVNQDGDLVVARKERELHTFGNILEIEKESKTFDVSEIKGAEAARKYHQSLNEKIEQENEDMVARATKSFIAYYDRDKTRRFTS